MKEFVIRVSPIIVKIRARAKCLGQNGNADEPVDCVCFWYHHLFT